MIEQKLKEILDSKTFKHSRNPSELSLIPDRLTDVNLRISEKVQLMMEGSSETGSIPHMSMTIEPETEEKSVNIAIL